MSERLGIFVTGNAREDPLWHARKAARDRCLKHVRTEWLLRRGGVGMQGRGKQTLCGKDCADVYMRSRTMAVFGTDRIRGREPEPPWDWHARVLTAMHNDAGSCACPERCYRAAAQPNSPDCQRRRLPTKPSEAAATVWGS